jgi:hypothetical protein
MKILCTAPGAFSGAELQVGHYYMVEPADTGTLAQNNTFHELLMIFFTSGFHSYNAKSIDEFKKYIKKDYGAGYESYVYIRETPEGLERGQVKNKSDVPADAARDKNGQKMVYGILKSWADYSRKERSETIERLISVMIQSGVSGGKFEQVLKAMEG